MLRVYVASKILCCERWKFDFYFLLPRFLIPLLLAYPSPFYDYYVIYSHTKHIFCEKISTIIVWLLFYESNFLSSLFFFFLFVSTKPVKFVKSKMKKDERCLNERNKCKFPEYLSMQMWNVWEKEKKKYHNNKIERKLHFEIA